MKKSFSDITKYIPALLTALVFMFHSPNSAASAPYVIDTLDVRMAVSGDNSYRVTETYEVTFNEQRHGIQRDLPLYSYRDRRTDIREVSAGGHQFTARQNGRDLTVRIGDPDRWAYSKERYVLSYIYDVGDDGIDDMDELYYNLVADYDTRINKMTFTIEMPYPFDAARLNFTYGRLGRTGGGHNVAWRLQGTVIKGRLDRVILPHEYLTVALPLPEGYYRTAAGRIHGGGITVPMPKAGFLWFTVPGALVSFLIWYFLCKERRIFPTVEFYPPEGFTPADAAYVMKGRVSLMDAVSLIIYWAGKGYLHIAENGRDGHGFTLTKLRGMDEDGKPYEKNLFNSVFSFRHVSQVTTDTLGKEQEFYTALSLARAEAVSFHNGDGTRIFEKGKRKRVLLVALPAFICLWGAWFAAACGDTPLLQAAGAALILSGLCMAALRLFSVIFASLIMFVSSQRFPRLLILPVILSVPAVTVFKNLPLLYGLCGLVPLFVPAVLMFKCVRRTDLGLKYTERLTGFKTFLETAERDRIDMLAEGNPQYFYDVLPYAAALDVTDTWTGKFEHIISRPPDWYEGSSAGKSFNASSFASDLSRGLGKAVNPPTRSSSSSGSRGGGSAGGGSGGGRGSSW